MGWEVPVKSVLHGQIMLAEMRHPLAYSVSAILGACILEVFAAAQNVDGSWRYHVVDGAAFTAVIIFFLILPFWIVFSLVAGRLYLKSVFAYALSGAILGIFAGTFYGACMPQMMWDTGPDLDFVGRGMRTFHQSSVMFATAGIIACSCYWLIAIRGRTEPKKDQPEAIG